MNLNIQQKLALLWALSLWLLPLPVQAASSTPSPLRMLLIPMKAPSRMYRDFMPLKQYLARKLNRPVTLDVAHKNSEIAAIFREKKTDIAFVCPTLYCDLARVVPVTPLVKLRINGRDQYRSVLVVREDSAIKRAADLIDKTLVYGRYNCPGSGLLPRIMMRRLGLTDETFFEVVKLGNDESALLAVMARMFDLTGVPEMAARPFTDKGLRILRYSRPIPQYLFVAHTGLGRDFIDNLKKVMLDLNQAPNRQDIIGGIEKGVDGLSDARDSDYDIVRVLAESLRLAGDRTAFRKGEHTLVVEPLYYAADLFWRLKPLLSRLREETGWNYHLRIPESMDAFLALRKRGEGGLFLQESGLLDGLPNPEEERLGSLAVVPEATNIGVIITAAAKRVKALDDLGRATIAIPSRLSEGGYLAQARWLRTRGISMEAAQWLPSGTCENVLMRVYRGEVEAGFLTLDTLKRLQNDLEPRRVVILAETPPLDDWVITARNNIRRFVKDKIRKILEEKDLYPHED